MRGFKEKKFYFFRIFILLLGSWFGTFSLYAGEVFNTTTFKYYADDLQTAIDEASSGDKLVLLGEFKTDEPFIIQDKSLILRGPAVLNGKGKTRVLEITKNSETTDDVVIHLRRLVIKNGRANENSTNGGNGGGILNVSAKVILKRVKLLNNKATSTGGGIANVLGKIEFHQSIIRNNTAASGGGINNLVGNLIIERSIIIRNEATDSGGGGVLTNGAALSNIANNTISNSEISENIAALGGGGVYNGSHAATVIKRCLVRNNKAALGGGVYNDNLSTSLKIRASRVNHNKAKVKGGEFGFGGGLYISEFAGVATLKNSKVNRNTAESSGGGIFNNADDTKLVLDNTEVLHNDPDQIAP